MTHRVEKPADLKFHRDAFEFAKELIKNRKVNCNVRTWTVDQPTPADQNDYLKKHGMLAYGKWFLATKVGTDKNTKEHYEFPMGNFKELSREGIISIKVRAAQFKHHEIEKAAADLLDLINQHACKK